MIPSTMVYRGLVNQDKFFPKPVLFFIAILLTISPLTSSAETEPDSTETSSLNGTWNLLSLPSRASIRFYQIFIAEQDLPTCNFQPSCSAFSFESYKTTDPFQATLMTFDRLMRCNYWAHGEYPIAGNRFVDPVTDHMLWGMKKNLSKNILTGTPLTRMMFTYESDNTDINTRTDMKFADTMALTGETELALGEYRRLSKEFYPSNIRMQALFHGGWMLFNAGRYEDAAATFREVLRLASPGSDETSDAATLELLALTMLKDQKLLTTIIYKKALPVYISAWGNIRQGQFENARKQLKELVKSSDNEIKRAGETIQSYLDSLETQTNKRGWIAGSFSMLIPGLGRVYTGRYGDSAFSFITTAGTAGLAVRAYNTGPWTKTAVFAGTASGFYLANIYGSIISARTENRRNCESITAAIVNYAEEHNILPRQFVLRRLADRLPTKDNVNNYIAYPNLAKRSLKKGDKYYIHRQWNEAIRCYRQSLFFSEQAVAMDSVLFRLGRSLEYSGADEKACVCYERLLDQHPESNLTEYTRLALTQLYLRTGNQDLALLECEEQIEFGTDPELIAEAELLKTFFYLDNHDWDSAREWIEARNESDYPEDIREASQSIYSQLKTIHCIQKKSPRLARVLSTVIPGLGQIYAGKPLNGIAALLISSHPEKITC